MSIQLSHSLHVSSGEHTISNSKQLRKVANHNSRKFSKSNNPRLDLSKSNLNYSIIGSDNIFLDVKALYEKTFDLAVEEYNSKQKRSDRKIENYFNHIDNSKQSNLAEEIIVQFGSAEDFEGFDWNEGNQGREIWTEMFESYLEKLKNEIPNFRIANATVHFDESSPHLHIVGVPIKKSCKRGVETQVSKSANFSRESMSRLQEVMGNHLNKLLKEKFNNVEIKRREKGRNENFNTSEIIEYKKEIEQLQQTIKHLKERLGALNMDKIDYIKYCMKFNVEDVAGLTVMEINEVKELIGQHNIEVDQNLKESLNPRTMIEVEKKEQKMIMNFFDKSYPKINNENREKLINNPYLKKAILKDEQMEFSTIQLLAILNGDIKNSNSVTMQMYSREEQKMIKDTLLKNDLKNKRKNYDFEI